MNAATYIDKARRRELQFKAQMGNAAVLISREDFQKEMIFVLQTTQTFQARVRFLNREGRQDRGEKTIVASSDGRMFIMKSSPQPLMVGQVVSAVEELEKAHGELGVDPEKDLLALNLVEKSVMKMRRALTALQSRSEPPEAAAELDEPLMVIVATAGPVDQTPLQKAEGYLRHTVASVRYALDLDEARWTLDEVETSTAALRALLWEKASRRD